MIPGRRPDEVLDDLALDIDERRDVLGILPGQVGQQSLEVKVHVALAGSGLQHVLIGHDELVQTIHHLREDVGGDDTIAQDLASIMAPATPFCFWTTQKHLTVERTMGLRT